MAVGKPSSAWLHYDCMKSTKGVRVNQRTANTILHLKVPPRPHSLEWWGKSLYYSKCSLSVCMSFTSLSLTYLFHVSVSDSVYNCLLHSQK